MAPRFDSILKSEREKSGVQGGPVTNVCVACIGDLAEGFSNYARCLLPDRTPVYAMHSEEGHLHICCNSCHEDGSRDCLEVPPELDDEMAVLSNALATCYADPSSASDEAKEEARKTAMSIRLALEAKKPLADHLYAHSGFRDRDRSNHRRPLNSGIKYYKRDRSSAVGPDGTPGRRAKGPRCYLSAEVETQADQITTLEDELRKAERKIRQLKAEIAHMKEHVDYLVYNAPRSKAYQDKYRKFLAEHDKPGASSSSRRRRDSDE